MAEETVHDLFGKLPGKLQHSIRRMSFRLCHPRQFHKFSLMRSDPPGGAIDTYLNHDCIFVHIPKCAGNAIEISLWGKRFGGHHTIWLYQMIFTPEEFSRFFKFSVVRNPWDRLASAYFFLKNGGMNEFDRAWADKTLSAFADFNSFVRGWVNEHNIETWVHFQPQTSFLCLNGKLMVDYVAHMETLEQDFQYICRQLHIDGKTLHTVNARKKTADYRQHYTDETREIVARVYAGDINLFGYEFDGIAGISPTI